jgi:hypothetical protein
MDIHVSEKFAGARVGLKRLRDFILMARIGASIGASALLPCVPTMVG